jgi:hypothetical protein
MVMQVYKLLANFAFKKSCDTTKHHHKPMTSPGEDIE